MTPKDIYEMLMSNGTASVTIKNNFVVVVIDYLKQESPDFKYQLLINSEPGMTKIIKI